MNTEQAKRPAHLQLAEEIVHKVMGDLSHKERIEFLNSLHDIIRERYTAERDRAAVMAKENESLLSDLISFEASLDKRPKQAEQQQHWK